jgi:hypothetical protein
MPQVTNSAFAKLMITLSCVKAETAKEANRGGLSQLHGGWLACVRPYIRQQISFSQIQFESTRDCGKDLSA